MARNECVDYHVHYDPSNSETGFLTIDKAARNGVVSMSLLARERVNGDFEKFVHYGKGRGVEVLSGVEHSVITGKTLSDIISIGFDPTHEEITSWLTNEATKKACKELARKQKYVMEVNGFSFAILSEENGQLLKQVLKARIVEKAITLCKIIVRSEHPTNIERMQELKQEYSKLWEDVKDKYAKAYAECPEMFEAKFLWFLYFAPGQEGYFAIQKKPEDAMKRIHDAGGVSLYSPEGRFDQEVWSELKSKGIDGIMAWHGGRLGENHGNVDIPRGVLKDCIKEGLLILGGSDYQGLDWEVGTGQGDMFISSRRSEEVSKALLHGRLR